MDLGLRDRVAIVGGASRGLGRAIALALAHEGANVTICGQNDEALRRTEIELARVGSQHHVLAIPADIATARDIRRVVRDTFNRFDQVSILVTQVGSSTTGPAVEFEDEAISTYRHGEFEDLCAGPHVESTSKIPAFKLLSVAGAYWRGD